MDVIARQHAVSGTARRYGSGRVLAAMCMVVVSYGLLQTMLVPTLGALQRDLRTTTTAASWAVLSAMLLASAVVTPVVSRLGDRFGKRRVLLWMLAIYLAATLASIAAPDIGTLIACRAVQGVSLTLLPLTFAILREALPASRAHPGLAVASGLVTGTAGVGVLLGGLVVDHASWRWLFAIGAVPVSAALIMTARWIPESRERHPGRLDVAGTATMTAGLLALLLAVTQGPAWGWTNARVLGLFGTAVAMLAVFVAVERRAAHPIVDLALLTKPPLTAAHLGALLLGVNQFAVYVALPKLAELPTGNPGFGLSVTGAALVLVPGTLMTMPASWAAPALADRFGVRAPLTAGLTLAAAGTALLAVTHASVWHAVLHYAIASVGWGLAMAALPGMVNAACPQAQSGSANGLNTVARTIGGALGGQLAAAVLVGWAAPRDVNTGFTVAFSLAAGVAAMGGLLVPLWLFRDRGHLDTDESR